MTAQALAEALDGRRVGNQYMARCPVHEDRTPSLAITEKSGKILVKCFAGCSQRDVIAELERRGVWASEPREFSFQQRVQCSYNYTDAAGKLLYQVVRLHSPKDFRQRYPDPTSSDGWRWKKHAQQVLYHLPEVMEASILFLTEGEKDAETLRSYGFCATCEAGGCNATWLDSYTRALVGREVNIIPDNDKPGWERATRIARALFGHAARVRLFDLPLDVKDASEWFEGGRSECELIARLEGADAV